MAHRYEVMFDETVDKSADPLGPLFQSKHLFQCWFVDLGRRRGGVVYDEELYMATEA